EALEPRILFYGYSTINLDLVAQHSMRIKGWAFDPTNTNASVMVKLKVGNQVLAEIQANLPSDGDIATWESTTPLHFTPGYGHRFDYSIRDSSLFPPNSTITLTASWIDASQTSYSVTQSVQTVIGGLANQDNNVMRVIGGAGDPNSGADTDIEVFVDGVDAG